MTRSMVEIADALMEEANGLRRDANTLLGSVEGKTPARIVTGAEAQSIIDDLVAAARLAETSARELDAATMRLQLLGAVIAALSAAIENGAENDEGALVETAGQLRLLLLDCVGCKPN